MTRLTFVFTLIAIAVIGFLGIALLKQSYKLLPIGATKEFAPLPFADWHSFETATGKFRVMLPTLPQHATQTNKDSKTEEVRHYDMYVAEKLDGSIFMVSLITFPDSKEAPEMIQKTVVNDLLISNPTNQLKNMKVGAYKKFKTIDFAIENNEMTIHGMTFVDGDTLYLLSAIFRNSSYSPAEYEYFIKSFELGPVTKAPQELKLP